MREGKAESVEELRAASGRRMLEIEAEQETRELANEAEQIRNDLERVEAAMQARAEQERRTVAAAAANY